jgi:hypothetical protein
MAETFRYDLDRLTAGQPPADVLPEHAAVGGAVGDPVGSVAGDAG